MFKVKANQINTNTLAITDFRVLSPQLAKVIISYTGKHTKQSIHAAVGAKLDHRIEVIENSFRQVKPGVAIGYVRANTEVRPVTEQEVRANYKVMSSNILMDQQDKSLWEVKNGAGGKYLARHGHEDLSELIDAHVHRRGDVPNIRQIALASAANREFVAFISASGDMDYGFATGVREDAVRVVSSTTQLNTVVPKSMICASFQLEVPREVHKQIVAAGISAADKAQAKEYYTQLYSYAPAYLAEVIKQIEEGVVA